MKNARASLFRVFVVVSGGLLLYSWFVPWWAARVQELRGTDHVVIHPWGLQVNSPRILQYLPPGVDLAMPSWFTPVMWAYLGLAIAALLFSLFANDKPIKVWKVRFTLPSLIIGAVGLSYVVVVISAGGVTAMRLADSNMPLTGRIVVDVGSDIGTGIVYTGLQLGYMLAAAAGLALIVIALLREKIIGVVRPTGPN